MVSLFSEVKGKCFDRYVLISVDTEKKTADVESVSDLIVRLQRHTVVALSVLDESAA
jgi:hypothetical protein